MKLVVNSKKLWGSNGQLGSIWINQGPVLGLLGYADATMRPQVLQRDSMKMNWSNSEPYFVFQISQPPNIAEKCFCIQNLQMDLSFQEKKK